jgi:hypothetical protein
LHGEVLAERQPERANDPDAEKLASSWHSRQMFCSFTHLSTLMETDKPILVDSTRLFRRCSGSLAGLYKTIASLADNLNANLHTI